VRRVGGLAQQSAAAAADGSDDEDDDDVDYDYDDDDNNNIHHHDDDLTAFGCAGTRSRATRAKRRRACCCRPSQPSLVCVLRLFAAWFRPSLCLCLCLIPFCLRLQVRLFTIKPLFMHLSLSGARCLARACCLGVCCVRACEKCECVETCECACLFAFAPSLPTRSSPPLPPSSPKFCPVKAAAH